MINYHGPAHYAKLFLSPPLKQVGRLPKPNPIHEPVPTKFTGLTTNMAGRDLQGYAICKNFSDIPAKPNLSKRLVNPVQYREQYPQRKPKTISKSIPDIRPSEIDLLTTKALISRINYQN